MNGDFKWNWGLERVLGFDPGVRVFAPRYPNRKDRVLGQLWYFPISKIISIDLKLVIGKDAEKFWGHGKFDNCSRYIFETFVSMDHFASDARVFWQSFTWTRAQPTIAIYVIQIPDLNLFFMPIPALGLTVCAAKRCSIYQVVIFLG